MGHTPLLPGFQVAGAATACVGDQFLGPRALLAFIRFSMGIGAPHRRTGCPADSHDHLVITIQRVLGVVALDPVAGAFEYVSVGNREIPFRTGSEKARRIDGQQAGAAAIEVDQSLVGALIALGSKYSSNLQLDQLLQAMPHQFWYELLALLLSVPTPEQRLQNLLWEWFVWVV